MNMKRLTSWIVTGAMVLGLSACGTNGATSDNADNSQNTSTPAITEPVDASSQTQEVEKTTPDTAETTPVSQEETPVPEEVGPKFTEVNETVYATTSVNVRASYSADSDKVGSLSAGASVTRTGVGNNGWSRIIYNGNEAYVSSDYLTTSKSSTSTPSTSKPSTSTPSTSKPSTSTPSTSKPSTSTPSTSTPSSGGDTLTDEEKANGEAFDQTVEDMGGYIDGGAFWVP
jgi:uncharacterized protein YgiM (DUF1202 family)